MKISDKTLEKLRDIINEESEYRSGPKLVAFFNELGNSDSYGPGFPSRCDYTNQCLLKLNGKPELDLCIKKVFSPIHFAGRIGDLQKIIDSFNQYLVFDGWKVVIKNNNVTFEKATINVEESIKEYELSNHHDITEDVFLRHDFSDIHFSPKVFDNNLISILDERIAEIKLTIANNAPLATIFLLGSTLEGILLAVALKLPKQFNTSACAPKDKDGNVRKFPEWGLSNFIDVAYDNKVICADVRKFSHSLRDFRNYIHPYEQMTRRFSPEQNTAKICFHVLKAAIVQINRYFSQPSHIFMK